ncbi:TetR/AcrR family transcriptional regulator [Catellatospora sp. NPDC049609]|uniref:TetR/AcrR family transcriptional regulator n=1 Tax=Catellatospora sp. NPDC049609 TaxID=3155505 RepID=UPI0034294659
MALASSGSGAEGSGDRSIWTRPERGRRGPAPAHSRETIVGTAIQLADTGGLDAVSMRAVAAGLGMAVASLYRHLSSREDLLDLMVDRCVGELSPYPQGTGSWQDELTGLARRQLALFQRHPWLREAIGHGPKPGPHTLSYFDECLRILRPVRCGTAAKFEAIAMLTGVVSLFAAAVPAPDASSAPAPGFGDVDPAAYPHLVAAVAEPAGDAPRRDLFERTVRGLLTGLLADDPG